MKKPTPSRTTLQRSLVGPAGEHYVLYQLHRQGIMAAMAPRNAPTVDVLVLHEDETISASIQVKTRTSGKDKGWHMHEKHERIEGPRLFYAFVDMEPEVPAVFVVPSAVVADVVRRSHTIWLETPGKNGQRHNPTPLRRINPEYQCPVPDLAPDWLEKYRNAWDRLRNVGTAPLAPTSSSG